MKILFFIESLTSGGKERRLLELISFLKKHTNFRITLVLTEDIIHYRYVNQLDINLIILKRKRIKKDPGLFFRFYKLCNQVKPDIIHTWGSMLAFYSIPVVLVKGIPHINSHITNAPLKRKKFGFQNIITLIGFKFSRIILANSYAGLKAYGVNGNKCRVIYNGIRLDRFSNLPDKELVRSWYNIRTKYAVIMVASYTKNKNYRQFIEIAEFLSVKRNDITFLGVGDTSKDPDEFKKIKDRTENMANVFLYDKTDKIEAIVNACDIGVLFTYSEGLSNSIIEYMACGKPVIANGAGGTKELITNGETGFLIENETTEEIADLIIDLIDNKNKRSIIGQKARSYVEQHLSVDRMGRDFCDLYSEVLEKQKID